MSSYPNKAPYADIVKSLGSNSAILLLQIKYWMKYTKVKINGKLWIAKPRKLWCDETGLTLKQYRNAIRKLKGAKYVEMEQHLFNGKNISFIRLIDSKEQGACN